MTRKPLCFRSGFLVVLGTVFVVWLAAPPVEGASVPPPGPPANEPATAPPAVITDVVLKTVEGSMVGLEILGSGFGTASPTKRLFIDGIQADVAEVYPWTDTKITVDEEVFFEITKNFIWVDHVYQWEIREGSTTISNVFPKRFLLEIHGVRPESGPPGATIEVKGAGFGHPGELMLGKAACQVASRTAGTVVARVPVLPAGSYKLGILQGTRLISNTVRFNVTAALKKGLD